MQNSIQGKGIPLPIEACRWPVAATLSFPSRGLCDGALALSRANGHGVSR